MVDDLVDFDSVNAVKVVEHQEKRFADRVEVVAELFPQRRQWGQFRSVQQTERGAAGLTG